jgi:UDP-GlcNAc:undecaprenyl-phosphate GlcNAc-1-phosphate transferase
VRRPDNALPLTHTLVATIWFAGVCHAFNLLDNMDGLAAGVAVIAAAFLAWLLGPSLGAPIVLLLVALCGALIGFLYWNRPPARLFMGDCGSLFIGAVLAGASLVPVLQERTPFPWTSMLVVAILVVPLFDTGFVLVLRRLAGRSATRGGTDHVSHRLVSLGFSERSAVRILYLLGIVGGLTAWALVTGGIEQMSPVAALFAVLVTLVGIYLARVPAYNAQDFKALERSAFAPLLKDLTFKVARGRGDAGPDPHHGVLLLCLPAALRGEGLNHFLPYFTASVPVVLGCKLASLYGSGLYQRSWQTFSLRDIAVVMRGVFTGSLLSVLAVAYFYRFEGFSRVVFIIDGLLLLIAIVATRASFRSMSLVAAARSKRSRRVLVYGAGRVRSADRPRNAREP